MESSALPQSEPHLRHHAKGPIVATVTVEPYLHGVQVDSFLVKHFRNYTTWRIQRMVRARKVWINHVPAESDTRVFRGQEVTIELIEPPDELIDPEQIPLDVIFEDAWMLVINKAPGQVTHPVGPFISGTTSNAVQHYLDQQTLTRGLLRPGIVHRLDRMTSGILLVPKEHLSHRVLSIQFQERKISKAYVALVAGEIPWTDKTITLPIGQIPGGDSILMSVRGDAIDPRPARTIFKVLKRYRGYSLVLAKPLTGRLHQIRVHLAGIGHPVIGDEFYGISAPDNWELEPSRHLLHACRIGFAHPIFHSWLELSAPVTADFQQVLRLLSRSQKAS